MEICGKTFAYASNKKKRKQKSRRIINAKYKGARGKKNETNKEEYKNKRDELRRLRERKLEGMIIRSRFKRELEGEKNSKYFF